MKLFNEQNYIPQLSIDCVIFGYKNKKLKVLVPKIGIADNIWSLPGGFILQEEDIDKAARRILEERTGLKDIYLEQFRVFGHVGRSNKEVFDSLLQQKDQLLAGHPLLAENLQWLTQRFVSIGYYALVDINKVHPQKVDFDESIAWYPVADLPKMIMDHNRIMEHALQTLRQNLDQKLIAFNLLPDTFTMRELQELYEAVYDKPFPRNNFQKKILDMNVLERLEKKFTGAQNKAPYLYRFKREQVL